MKAQILKLAGVKTEKEFYKKYPTEKSFMAKHGAKLQKADPGAVIGLKQPKKMDVNIATPTLTAIDPIVSKVGKSSGKFASYFGGIGDGLKNMKQDDVKGLASGIAGGLSGIIGGFNQLKEEKKQIANNNMWGNVSSVVAAAAGSRPQAAKKRDIQLQTVQNMNPLGVSGDNFLQAANGMMIGGNPTEIQNTYAPNVMYTDLGYEPLNDSNKVKNFKKGGKVNKAKSGVAQILGGVGSAASAIPGIGTVASIALPLLGDIYDVFVPDKNAEEIKKKEEEIAMNMGFAQGQNQVANTFGQYQDSGSVGRDGWVSHDWQPQVITKFGDLDVSQVHSFAHDGMPEYRAGGHLKEYTPPSAEAMYTGRAEDGGQYSLGGELKTLWGGEAESISYNPYLPGTGETVMFRGQSHDDTNGNGQSGIGVKYGDGGMTDYAEYGGNEQDADVEVERNEPGTELINPKTGEKELTVYGNMKIDKAAAAHIGDSKAEKMKYKNYVADLSKGETKANKTIEKATMLANNPDASKLELATAEAMMKGGDLTLAKIADQKIKTAEWQNATLDIAKKHGLKSDALAEGKLKIDKNNSMLGKFGAKLETAREGSHIKKFKEFEAAVNADLKKRYPGQNAHIRPMTGGVYNPMGGRDISSQAGIFKKGNSQTPVSAHNYNAARDYRIVIGDTEISPEGNEDMYADTLWPVAQRLGMYNVGDRDPKTPDKNWDPAHIGLAKEGKGTLYKELQDKYPDVFEDPNAKKTIEWIAKNKNADTTIAKHFRLINEAGVGKGVIKNVIKNVGNAINEVSPAGKLTAMAAKGVGKFLDATNSLMDAMITPDKAKGMFNTPSVDVGDWFGGDEKNPGVGKPMVQAKDYKVRPKGESRGMLPQPAVAPADSWADDGSKYWKPILGVPTSFPSTSLSNSGQVPGDSFNQDLDGSDIWAPKLGIPTTFPNAKNRTSLLGKDYDPGYDEQPFYKPRNFEYTPSGPLTETRTSTGGSPVAGAPIAVPPVIGKGATKGTGKGAAKTTAPVAGGTYDVRNQLGALGTMNPLLGQRNWNNELMDIQAQAAQTPQLQAALSYVDPRSAGWDGTDSYKGGTPAAASTTEDSSKGGGMSWENIIRTGLSSAYPFLRQQVTNPLDPSQLAPEMLAASLNQEEPVGLQSYSPMLAQPTRFSFQDQLNEITKQTRAAERMSPYNPEAQSIIAAGSYDARNKVLADQFRANQGEQSRVAEQNRAALNEAQRFNIGQYDQQMVRTSQAKSNTRQQKIEIAKSIADKIQQNKLETRQANLMQNMYPGFNFTQSGVAYKDPLYMASLNMSGQGIGSGQMPEGMTPTWESDSSGRPVLSGYKKKKDDKLSRNGSLVKAIKNL
jgi:hypothetical protein